MLKKTFLKEKKIIYIIQAHYNLGLSPSRTFSSSVNTTTFYSKSEIFYIYSLVTYFLLAGLTNIFYMPIQKKSEWQIIKLAMLLTFLPQSPKIIDSGRKNLRKEGLRIRIKMWVPYWFSWKHLYSIDVGPNQWTRMELIIMEGQKVLPMVAFAAAWRGCQYVTDRLRVDTACLCKLDAWLWTHAP